MIAINILLIDNYDSYTFNLVQSIDKIEDLDANVVVIRNDQLSRDNLLDILPHFDAVIISPGPGTPQNTKDVGICWDVLDGSVPVFGVCLGLQLIAYAFGSHIVEAKVPSHGVVANVQTIGSSPLFKGLPETFYATRYHSLVATNVKYPLTVMAHTADDGDDEAVVMALEHAHLPFYAVQFHPESICSEFGSKMISNFLKVAATVNRKVKGSQMSPLVHHIQSLSILDGPERPLNLIRSSSSILTTDYPITTAKSISVSAEFQNCAFEVFEGLFGSMDVSVWLDSARPCTEQGRFSMMAGFSKDDSAFEVYSYWADLKIICFERGGGGHDNQLKQYLKLNRGTFAMYLDAIAKRNQPFKTADGGSVQSKFLPGLYGYFGYEMKSECLVFNVEQKPDFSTYSVDFELTSLRPQGMPDSSFIFCKRMLAIDAVEGIIQFISIVDDDNSDSRSLELSICDDWFTRIHNILSTENPKCTTREGYRPGPIACSLQLDEVHKSKYINAIRECKKYIRKGESYELCLTNPLRFRLPAVSPTRPNNEHLQFYKNLRVNNSAPFGSFMKFSKSLTIASSSPEKFLSMNGGDIGTKSGRKVLMKPIKGTIKRGRTIDEDDRNRKQLMTSEKDRAENLMIVDLIRNDLNRICARDTVAVPRLMVIESYQTVHQLVSDVEGITSCSPFEVLHACFPPGSMTGAPKKRSVEILERLEGDLQDEPMGTRGIYSGVLGYVGLDGSCDFSVVIRTVVFSGNDSDNQEETACIGAGGAITIKSNDDDEYEEMLTKAASVYSTLKQVYGNDLKLC